MKNLNKLLESKVKECAQKYYSDGSSDISDAEFDKLTDALKESDPDSELLKTGWGYDVNLDTTPGTKVYHKYAKPGSLEKCRTWSELGSYLQDNEIYMSLKLDGISVVLYYTNGQLDQALTRGDGSIGIDITDKVKIIQPDLLQIHDKTFTGAVRGEILMSFDSFDKFKASHTSAKNPRNSTAGLINSKDAGDDLKYLDIIVYSVLGDQLVSDHLHDIKMSDMVAWLRNNFNNVAPYTTNRLKCANDEYINILNSLKDDWYGKYPADGIVLTYNQLDIDTKCHGIVYIAKAFKFESEQAECNVVKVNWELSKTRYMVPTIEIEPVELSGTTVSFMTGYNAKYIKTNKIGAGSKLIASKHGEIIPNVDKILSSGNLELPNKCPECNAKLVWSGVHLQCPNTSCEGGYFHDLLIWSDMLAPMDGLGQKLRSDYYRNVWQDKRKIAISTVMTDRNRIYDLRNNTSRDYNIQLNKFIDSVISMYENKFDVVTALKALNIPRFGDKTCENLAKYPDIIERIYNISVSKDRDTNSLIDIYGYIGDANADSLISNLDKFANIQYIWDRIIWDGQHAADKGRVAITGKLSVKRSEFEKELKAAGYSVAEINKNTRFLITDDPNSQSSKNIKADEWGIRKITEQEFRNKYM